MTEGKRYKSGSRSYGKRARKPPKQKRISVGGFTLEPGVSKADLRSGPTILPGLTAGDDDRKLAYALRRRSALWDALKGSGGYETRFLAPTFARGKAERGLYNPTRAGRPRETYFYFPILEFTVIREFDQDTRDQKQARVINRIDNYETIKRYFAHARVGAKASWSVRVPVSGDLSGDWSIAQTHQSYRKHGLDKGKLRNLIRQAEERMAGYAVVTGIRGVWRSQRSVQHWDRVIKRQVADDRERASRGEFLPRKRKQPHRSKRK